MLDVNTLIDARNNNEHAEQIYKISKSFNNDCGERGGISSIWSDASGKRTLVDKVYRENALFGLVTRSRLRRVATCRLCMVASNLT